MRERKRIRKADSVAGEERRKRTFEAHLLRQPVDSTLSTSARETRLGGKDEDDPIEYNV
jgi:hypothetical protein